MSVIQDIVVEVMDIEAKRATLRDQERSINSEKTALSNEMVTQAKKMAELIRKLPLDFQKDFKEQLARLEP